MYKVGAQYKVAEFLDMGSLTIEQLKDAAVARARTELFQTHKLESLRVVHLALNDDDIPVVRVVFNANGGSGV